MNIVQNILIEIKEIKKQKSFQKISETSMTAEDLLINNGSNGQAIEAVCEGLPQLDVVPSLACVCEGGLECVVMLALLWCDEGGLGMC